jgi:hypothetical protein
MPAKRLFKTKTFARWAKKILDDGVLHTAAREIEQGSFEADLGGGICKKRIALPGRGKRGSTRTLVAFQHPLAIVFLTGREKNEPGADFSQEVVEAARTLAGSLHRQSIEKLDELAAGGVLVEIRHGEEAGRRQDDSGR